MENVDTIPKGSRGRARLLQRAAALAALILGAAATTAGEVTLTVEHREGAYEVRGRFETAAHLDVVWDVLTDYAGIPRFVRSMRESVVEERKGARLRVRQEAVVGVFPLKRRARLVLDVQERTPERIEFRELSGHDFRFYRGAWDLAGDSTGTRVAYSLEADPTGLVPGWLGRNMMRRSAEELLEQVRDEIERRARAK
jgi:carbon monoxide dehydrogenase subunit G